MSLPAFLCAQNGSGYLTCGEPPKVAGKRNAAVQVKIPVTVKDGYHVNSNKPSDRIPDSVEADVDPTGALEAAR